MEQRRFARRCSPPVTRRRALRIAQVAPLFEAVPPAGYGGTELVVHLLTEELVRRGHDVTLFASGDSRTSAALVPGSPVALWSDRGRGLSVTETAELRAAHHGRPYGLGDRFDLIHDHSWVDGLEASLRAGAEHVLVTHHRRFDAHTGTLLAEFRGRHHAVSRAAAATFPPERQLPPVLHGVDVATYPFRDDAPRRDEGYLLFLGRFHPVKGAGTAVQVAHRAGRRLLLAARLHEQDRAAFERDVVPYLDGERIRYVGEVDARQKRDLLVGADALLFPISWDEPFGLVMVEALSCGTPVLATRRASTPEVIDDGETGFLAGAGDGSEADVEALLQALPALRELSRRRCREVAEERFTVERMVDDYESRYAMVPAPT